MTKPVKVTPRQFKRLTRNLGTPERATDGVLIDTMRRMFWDAWEVGKGRLRTLNDVHDEKIQRKILDFCQKYSKELKKKGE